VVTWLFFVRVIVSGLLPVVGSLAIVLQGAGFVFELLIEGLRDHGLFPSEESGGLSTTVHTVQIESIGRWTDFLCWGSDVPDCLFISPNPGVCC
jgi:hypothetical protein